MNNITEHIKKRRSVRTFDGRTLDENTKEQLLSFVKDIPNPFDIPIQFKFLDAKKEGLICPVVNSSFLSQTE